MNNQNTEQTTDKKGKPVKVIRIGLGCCIECD